IFCKQPKKIGNQTILWSFNDTKLIGYLRTAKLYVPNPVQNVSYRLSLYAPSSHPSTYLGVFRIIYQPEPYRCGHGNRPGVTTTSTTTISPAKSLNCDFEQNNFCNWKTHTNFVIGTSNNYERDSMFMPSGDHTKDSRAGHFAY